MVNARDVEESPEHPEPDTEYQEPDELELSRLEEMWQRLESRWPEGFPLHLERFDLCYESKLYRLLAAFPSVPREAAVELSLALRFLVCATLMTDKVIDEEADRKELEHDFFHIQIFQFECYQILYRWLPPEGSFWRRFRNYFKQFIEACLVERQFARGELPWSEYTEARALEIIQGKNGFARLLAASLAQLSDDESHFRELAESIEKHYFAWQLWDDLCDWKEDFAAGVPSWLLAQVVQELPPREERQHWVPHLARKIYYEGHAVRSLAKAISLLEDADQQVAHIPDLGWRQDMSDLRLQCTALHDDLVRIVEKNLKRAREQRPFELGTRAPGDRFEETAWGALGFLVDQWHLGFGEAQHIGYMGREKGYQGPTELPSGDVFQRALIADALCDADQWLGGQLRPVIESEARYLVSQRNTSRVGGWRYFPTILELAPDADDLGQVMQVLLRAGFHGEVEEHCTAALEVIRADAHGRGGAFCTWIIPEEDRDRLEETQARLRGESWGPGPDPEVMANLLYALVLWDRQRFADLIDPGVDLLESFQAQDGSWPTKWYWGVFYGTYVCLRLLAAVRPESSSIPKAADFLRQHQREDGGWGYAGESDPLSTSLGMLGLAESCAGSLPDQDAHRALRGLDCLERLRHPDGSWSSVPFIRLPDYGSRTATTLYALKACLACRGHEPEQRPAAAQPASAQSASEVAG
ncbi:MAG: hypothetical protein AAF560_14330 [Acidobacteriota bacterium]